MANISDANGIVILAGDWTPAMCQNLNVLKEEWSSWGYNIYIHEDFTPETSTYRFYASGRWSFSANLESLDKWTRGECETKPQLADAYAALTADMEKLANQIIFDYADEECGNQFICTGEYTFAAENGHLVIESSSEEPYEYTWENYLSLDFGGEDLFNEFVSELLHELPMNESEYDENREKVEKWVKENTTPHEDVECLDEEEFAAFKATFSSAHSDATTSNTLERSAHPMERKILANLRSLQIAVNPKTGSLGHHKVEVVIVSHIRDSEVIAQIDDKLYRGIFNIFAGEYFIDDADGYIGKAAESAQ